MLRAIAEWAFVDECLPVQSALEANFALVSDAVK
jgi:hypothetical protein